MIVIIDYKCGNLASIKNMIKKVGFDSTISSDINTISKARKLILPGVGNFKSGMKMIRELGLVDVLNDLVLDKKISILGLCLGMQLFTESSEEGNEQGFGWISGHTIKFDIDQASYKIPHMGWGEILIMNPDNKLLSGLESTSRFYFVHSYHVTQVNYDNVIALTNYQYDFPSVIGKNNIYGVQFHPEKSHKYGKKVIENFLLYC